MLYFKFKIKISNLHTLLFYTPSYDFSISNATVVIINCHRKPQTLECEVLFTFNILNCISQTLEFEVSFTFNILIVFIMN